MRSYEEYATGSKRLYTMQYVVSYYLYIINTVSIQVRDRDKQLKEQEIEKQRIIQKYNAKIEAEANRMTKEMEMKLLKQQELFEVYFGHQLYFLK